MILNNAFDVAPLMTLTRGSVTAGQNLANLGVTRGLTLSAGNASTGPGTAGGTDNHLIQPEFIRNVDRLFDIFTGDSGPLTQYMLMAPGVVDRIFIAGDTTATLTGFKSTAGSGHGTVALVAGALPAANFVSAATGTNKTVNFNGFTLAQGPIVTGKTGADFVLPVSWFAPIVGKTTGNINAGSVIVPPGDVVVPPIDEAS